MNIPCNIDPLGIRDIIPAGYSKIAYLESTGVEYIDTKAIPETASRVHCEFMTVPASSFCYVYGQQSENGLYDIVVKDQLMARCSWLVANTGLRSGWRALSKTKKYLVKSTLDELFIDGVKVATRVPGEYYYATRPIFLFASNMAGKPSGHLASKIYSFSLQRENKLDIELIPVINAEGLPCMFDTVSRQPFYNSGSGAFIAGIENQSQLNNLLSKLPDRSGQTVGTLQVRLADELQTLENEAKMDTMLAKNWEISQSV